LSVQYVRAATTTCNIARMDGVNDDEGEMVILNELIFDGIRGAVCSAEGRLSQHPDRRSLLAPAEPELTLSA